MNKAIVSKLAVVIVIVMLITIVVGCGPGGSKSASKAPSGGMMKGGNEPNPNAAMPGGHEGREGWERNEGGRRQVAGVTALAVSPPRPADKAATD